MKLYAPTLSDEKAVLKLCQEKKLEVGNNRKLIKDIKVIRAQKMMKTKALLGDQTFDHRLKKQGKWGE